MQPMQYQDVRTRFLKSEERAIDSEETQIPFVIEPDVSKQMGFLLNFLNSNSKNLLCTVATYGAVLFRGFDVQSEQDFENAMMGIKGINPMNSYFMSESGRVLVEGTRFVFYTNKEYKTGGSFELGGFHTENFNTADIPRYICFNCIKPSVFGGETGLIDMLKVYTDLSDNLKMRLASKTFLEGIFPVSEIAQRYSVSENRVKEICSEFGLINYHSKKGDDFLLSYKANVFKHPGSNLPVLLGNHCNVIPLLNNLVIKNFLKDYGSKRWLIHRLAWKYSLIMTAANLKIGKFLKDRIKQVTDKKIATHNFPDELISTEMVRSVIKNEDCKELASVMRKKFASFTWKKGDILLVDNLRMAHAGMPGFGSRTIRAIIANPVSIMNQKFDEGMQTIYENSEGETLSNVFLNQV